MSSQMGSVDAVVTLKAEAGVLTGQFDLGNGRTWPIEEGTIEGSSINFKINRDGADDLCHDSNSCSERGWSLRLQQRALDHDSQQITDGGR